MKKLLLAILLIIFSLNFAAAVPSESSFIPLDSEFYRSFDTLMRASGRQPIMTRPYTYGEAAMYLEEIDTEEFGETEMALYNDLLALADTDNGGSVMSFDSFLRMQPEISLHFNTETFRDRVDFLDDEEAPEEGYHYEHVDKYMLWDRDAAHFLDVDLALSFADTATLLFRLPVANTVHTGTPSGSRVLMTNIPAFASPADVSFDSFQDFSMNFPYRAHISIAGSWYSVMIGRERLNFGSGISGNFVIDKSLPYHNALSLSFFTKTFKYNFLVSFFPHPSQYITGKNDDGTEYVTDLIFDQNENAFSGTKMFMSHRFDWTMGNGKHRFALTEGIIYQNDKGILDLQVLNPMMFFHNMYIAGNSNSILQFEWDVSLAKGVSQHMAIAVDDFNIPFEQNDGSDPRPNAIGIQYGIRTSHALGKGFLESYAEMTYMSPYFYLRDGKEASDYPVDFVIAVRNQRSGHGVYDLYSIGYPNGGDQFIAGLGLSYRIPRAYGFSFDAEYRLYGSNNLMTVYTSYPEGNGRKRVHSLSMTLSAECSLTSSMTAGASLESRIFFGFENAGGGNASDLALKTWLTYIF